MKIMAKTMELAGSSYEIGYILGKKTEENPQLQAFLSSAFPGFHKEEVAKARQMFGRWCPGLNEELEGFADALSVPAERLVYWGMTSLRPRCSQIAVLPSKSKEGIPLLARNYEFHPEAEDFNLVRTSVTGKYTHLGTSVLLFGRDDGMNECGLAVTMSSCGFPVGAIEYMRKPKIHGLQFWAVIRSVLEHCRDVEDALAFLKEMPIAYNLNMMLMDKSGNAALVETLDGRTAVKRPLADSGEDYLCATNHPVVSELIPYEPQAMRHSLVRHEWIRRKMDKKEKIGVEDLKQMLHSEYPDGLCCHYFQDYFGTTKSMVFSPVHGTISLSWGGEERNGWNDYPVAEPIVPEVREIEIHNEPFPKEIGAFIPLRADGVR